MDLNRDIVLLQRGDPAVITSSEYMGGWSRPLETLVAGNIVTVDRSGNDIAVRPGNYVGLARTSSGTLRIAPRSEKLLEFLLHRYRDAARNLEFSGLSGIGTARDLVAFAFECCRNVIASGGPAEYERVTTDTETRGAFVINESIRKFWSRGMSHRAVRSYSKLKRPSSAATLAGLVLVQIQSDYVLSEKEFFDFERVISALGRASDWTHLKVPSLIREVRLFDSLELEKLSDLAEVIFSLGASQIDVLSGTEGDLSFRFYDTESLWERALADMISFVADEDLDVKVHPLRKTTSHFLAPEGPNIDPDIIVYDTRGEVRLVVDAKSFHANGASANDVYQMFAYMSHVECDIGLLIYICRGPSWHKTISNGNMSIYSFGIAADSLTSRVNAQLELKKLWATLPYLGEL